MADLKGRSVRGGAVTLAAQVVRVVVQLGSLAVLARLLAPGDFGLVAMVTAVTGFVMLFKDLGLSAATIQRSEITHGQVSTLFWINIGFSLLLMMLTMALAPAVAAFYGDPRLTAITVALATTFFLGGLGIQHSALLQRQMRFVSLATVNTTAVAAGAGAGILSAALGAGYWALVFVTATTSLAGSIGLWIANPWRPSWSLRVASVRGMLGFGGYLAGYNVVNYVARKSDDILIGWALGAYPLGLYNRAYQLLSLPIGQINAPMSGVVIPGLSRLRKDEERYLRYYQRAMGFLASVGMPIVAFCLADAEHVILLLFGAQWADAVPIFRALGVAAFAGAANMATGWVYVSLGRTKRMFRWGLISVPLIVLAFAAGLPYGPVGVATACSVVYFLLWFVSVAYCFKGTMLRVTDVLTVLWRPALASAAAALAALAFGGLLTGLAGAPRLLLDGLVFLLAYVVTWLITPGGTDHLRQLASAWRMLRGAPDAA